MTYYFSLASLEQAMKRLHRGCYSTHDYCGRNFPFWTSESALFGLMVVDAAANWPFGGSILRSWSQALGST